MPLFNVELTKKLLIVVEAENDDDALRASYCYAEEAFRDSYDYTTDADVCGEVTKIEHLRDGWDGECLPYGDNTRNKTIAEILKD